MSHSPETITARGLHLVSASAGSGKTYRLTQEVTRALNPDAAEGVEVEGLVAVTYTLKAQAELISRLRRALVKQGAFERAQQLPLAYLGTVHSVCLRLVKEFAIDAGLSPTLDGMPAEAARRLLQEALEFHLPPELWDRLEALAAKLEIRWDGRVDRYDWITPVEEIMLLARSNRILPPDLPAMAARSFAEYSQLLSPPVPDGKALESELTQALTAAIEAVGQLGDGQKNTADALSLLRESASKLARGALPWSGWQKLAAVAPGKRALPLVEDVQRVAASYLQHPELHTQLRELTVCFFEAARFGLEVFSSWKAERGLVDYVDMIDRALSVLDVPEVVDELRERLSLLVVDEFQDTSPIQLALFMRLHALAGRSLWVGDRKQCIFEYAGADPALMEATAHWVSTHGGGREVLKNNYRSRPELVHAVSALFAAAFKIHGHSAEDVVTTPKREAVTELSVLPPVGVWWLTGKQEARALAAGVVRLLQAPEATPVLDSKSGLVRPVRPADIAILVYSNAEAKSVSVALKERGIASVLPRVGLVRTPEGTLIGAALRLLVDAGDRLAAAEVDALCGFDGQSHEVWLQERVQAYRAYKHPSGATEAQTELSSQRPGGRAVQDLRELRRELAVLSPTEVLDRVLAVLDLARLAQRWPEPEQRLANLEALRALAVTYEARCAYLREAASLAGLIRYFEDTQVEVRQRDEERATDEQHVGNPEQAVVISTYHKAKGLEWPVVILAGLNRERKRDAFEVAPESEGAEFDASNPLAGRYIRYWPWPLGQLRNAPLAEHAAASPKGRLVTARDARERGRLLYVGFTRARDHLVLAVKLGAKGKANAIWLEELADDQGPLLALPTTDADDAVLQIRGLNAPCHVAARVWGLDAGDADVVPERSQDIRTWFAKKGDGVLSRQQFLVVPSKAEEYGSGTSNLGVVAVRQLAKRVAFANPGNCSWDHIGTTLHAFLAADQPNATGVQRFELASGILARAGLAAVFEPEAFLAASDALREFVTMRWPGAIWHREVPVVAGVATATGSQQINGVIDLLLEVAEGYVILDHKSFPGRADQWAERALSYAPQLLTYQRALEAAGGRVLGRFVHFPIGGGLVELA
jgi:ATP-dependent exoDNAse (exonuclease V) beta subunit